MSEEVTFAIGSKAEELVFRVFDITTNRSHYPVKYRRLTDKLQEYALEIHSDVMDANAYRENTAAHKTKRHELQTLAITRCNKFMCLVKYSLHAQLISFATSEEWTNLVHDIKYMTLAWRKN